MVSSSDARIFCQMILDCRAVRKYFSGQEFIQAFLSQLSRDRISGVGQADNPAFRCRSSCASNSQRASRVLTVRTGAAVLGWGSYNFV